MLRWRPHQLANLSPSAQANLPTISLSRPAAGRLHSLTDMKAFLAQSLTLNCLPFSGHLGRAMCRPALAGRRLSKPAPKIAEVLSDLQ